MKTVMAVLAIWLTAASAAWAQGTERGFIQGVGGLTFGTETSGMFAGGFGANVAPAFQITGEIGYMRNVLPKSLQVGVDDAASLVEDVVLYLTGVSVDVRADAKVPAFYGMAGGRLIAPTSGPARPFVGVSAGFAHVSPQVHLSIEGQDVTDEAIADGVLDPVESVSKFLMAVNGGVRVNVGSHGAVEIGYAYTRVFANQGINVHRAYGALGYRF